jgi:hypothetical protein
MNYLRISFFVVLFGLLSGAATAQENLVDFTVTVTVTDGTNSTTLTLGMEEGASVGRDDFDQLAPPPPPAGAFDGRLVGPDNDYFTDVRPLVSEPTEFEVAYQPADRNGPIELSWDPDALADYGSFVIVDLYDTGTISVDMTETGSLDTSTESVLEDGLIIRATAKAGDAIPVELSAFDARVRRQDVQLRWRTESETDNAGFAVEQRAEGAPFQEVGFVEGAGTTSRPQAYRYTVENVEPGTYDFRLRQVDHDGTSAYSAPVPVRVTVGGAFWLRGPVPNPVRDHARFELAVDTSQRIVVEVYDSLGRRMHRYNAELAAHRTTALGLNVDRLGLSSGTYFLQVRGETFLASERLSVVR